MEAVIGIDIIGVDMEDIIIGCILHFITMTI